MGHDATSDVGTSHVPFLLVLFPWASPMGLDPLFPFAGRKDGGCWSVLGPFSRASRSNLKLTSLTSRSGYLVLPITEIETFPAISYERALILPTDRNLSSTESA